jgi:hypothetical protein
MLGLLKVSKPECSQISSFGLRSQRAKSQCATPRAAWAQISESIHGYVKTTQYYGGNSRRLISSPGSTVIARKSTPRTGGLSSIRNSGTYVKAHQRAFAWAEKAIAERHAGKRAQAKASVEKSRYWLRKITMLEAAAEKRRTRAKS